MSFNTELQHLGDASASFLWVSTINSLLRYKAVYEQ